MSYNEIYSQENYFGDPLPELIHYFEKLDRTLSVLDLGCGQGRNALHLGRLGFEVTGVDLSETGIKQLNQTSEVEGLNVRGIVRDLYQWERFQDFDVVLLDSMFHFGKKERSQELWLLNRIYSSIKSGSRCVVCIQDTGQKVSILKKTIPAALRQDLDQKAIYRFKDADHQSVSDYRVIALKKI